MPRYIEFAHSAARSRLVLTLDHVDLADVILRDETV